MGNVQVTKDYQLSPDAFEVGLQRTVLEMSITSFATPRLSNSVSASLVTLISSKPRVYLLKDRDPVRPSASRSVEISK